MITGSLLIFNNFQLIQKFSKENAIDIISSIIDISSQQISIEEKTNKLIEKKVFYKKDKKNVLNFVNKLQISNNCKLRIDNLKKNDSQKDSNELIKEKELEEKTKQNNNEKPIINKDNPVSRSPLTNTACTSPYNNNFVSFCPCIDQESFVNFISSEISEFIDEITPLGYIANVSNEFSSNMFVPDCDNDFGTYQYTDVMCPPHAGILYFASHGNPTGIGIAFATVDAVAQTPNILYHWLDCTDVYDPNFAIQNVIIVQSQGMAEHPWSVVATPEWFSTTSCWQSHITSDNSIAFLTTCYSSDNNCVQACINNNIQFPTGVAFGYEGDAYRDNILINNQNLLKRLNGIIPGNYRSTSDIYSNCSWQDNFKMVPTDAKITLCPAPTSYSPLENAAVEDEGDGFIEFDTWCKITFIDQFNISNPDNPLIFHKSAAANSTIDITNVHWVDYGSGKSNRIEYAWSGTGSFTVSVTINAQKIQSWNNSTDDGHYLDFDKVAPNGHPKSYSFSNNGPIYTADFSYQQSTGTTLYFEGNTNFAATDWAWDFGDGSSGTGQSVTNTYSYSGTYIVTLTATKNTISVPVSHSIVVIDENSFQWLTITCSTDPYSPNSGVDITFHAGISSETFSSSDYTYTFEVYDPDNIQVAFTTVNTTYAEAEYSNSFTRSGLYSMRVTVFDNFNSNLWGSCEEFFYVSNSSDCSDLYAGFSYTTNINSTNSSLTDIHLTDECHGGTTPYTSWRWDFFPDPVTGNAPFSASQLISGPPFNPNGDYLTYIWNEWPGEYPVMLTVTDGNYCTNSYLQTISILDPGRCYSNLRIISDNPTGHIPEPDRIVVRYKNDNGEKCGFYLTFNYDAQPGTCACWDFTDVFWYVNSETPYLPYHNSTGFLASNNDYQY